MPDHVARAIALPMLIADDAALDRYLAGFHGDAYAMHRHPAGVSLADWLASGEDACERCYLHAQRLGLPLVRLPEVTADPAAAALLPPEQERRLRVVP